MTITFCIEARNADEDTALHTERAPELNVHYHGGWRLLSVLAIDYDHYGTIDAADLLARLDTCTADDDYTAERLPALRDIAAAAQRLGRQVVWG